MEFKTKFYALPLNSYRFEFYDNSGNVTDKDSVERCTFGRLQDICNMYCKKGIRFKLYIFNPSNNHLRFIASNMEGV